MQNQAFKDVEMGKKIIQENFKMDDEMQSKLLKAAGTLDESKSKVIRACIHLALPTLEANPLLIRLIED